MPEINDTRDAIVKYLKKSYNVVFPGRFDGVVRAVVGDREFYMDCLYSNTRKWIIRIHTCLASEGLDEHYDIECVLGQYEPISEFIETKTTLDRI